MIVQPLFQDPFAPKLFSSPALNVSQEQRMYVREILETGASDSRFAQKMYDAIVYVLTAGNTIPPVVTILNPSTAVLGSASFTLSVKGTGFSLGSVIIWNGSPEPTTYVSTTEITTDVDMSTAEVAMDIPVMVQNADGVLSNVMSFSLTSPAARSLGKTHPVVEKKLEVDKEEKHTPTHESKSMK